MSTKKIQEYVSEWMDEFGKNNGYELSRCEFVKEGSDWFLRVYVDKLSDGVYGYMSSDDCETVSRFLSAKLDEYDPVEHNYYLEVSSPGLDRLLVSAKDYLRFTGCKVNVRLYKSINGIKHFEAILKNYDNEVFTFDHDGTDLTIGQDQISKINLVVDI